MSHINICSSQIVWAFANLDHFWSNQAGIYNWHIVTLYDGKLQSERNRMVQSLISLCALKTIIIQSCIGGLLWIASLASWGHPAAPYDNVPRIFLVHACHLLVVYLTSGITVKHNIRTTCMAGILINRQGIR